jgi:hypothetical protein
MELMGFKDSRLNAKRLLVDKRSLICYITDTRY